MCDVSYYCGHPNRPLKCLSRRMKNKQKKSFICSRVQERFLVRQTGKRLCLNIFNVHNIHAYGRLLRVLDNYQVHVFKTRGHLYGSISPSSAHLQTPASLCPAHTKLHPLKEPPSAVQNPLLSTTSSATAVSFPSKPIVNGINRTTPKLRVPLLISTQMDRTNNPCAHAYWSRNPVDGVAV